MTAPVNTVAPTIVGPLRPGQRLSSTTGTWTGSPTSFSYLWQVSQSSSPTGPWADIPREDGSGYGIDFDFVGRRLRLMVTATNGTGSTQAYSAASNVIADDDPVFAGSPVPWVNPGTTGQTVNLAGGRFTVSGVTYLPAGTTINGPGEILFANDVAILSVTTNTNINNVTFTGTLSDPRQFTLIHDGVAALFASATFIDSGFGMTSPISGGVMSINLNNGTQRQVISQLIPLDSSRKYAVRVMPGFASGSGHMPMVLERCNSGGTELGEFNPQDVGVWLSIVNTEALKIKVGAVRLAGTPTGQIAAFDLTKIKIYEVINDFSALIGGSPHQNTSNIFIGGASPTFTDCRFRRMKFAPAKVVVGTDAQFIRPIVRSSLGCISSQGSDRTIIEDMNSDIRATDQHGNLVPTGIAARNHNILYSGNPSQGAEIDSKVVRGVFTGASWSFECPENGFVSEGIDLDGLKITAEHCGISNCSTNGETTNCDVRMHPLGYIGIEIPTANGAQVVNNRIYQDSVARQGHGVAASNGNIGAVIDNNWIHTGVGIQITHPANTCIDRSISVRGNTIYYSVNALAYNVGGINFENNTGGRTTLHGMRGGGAPLVFQVWGCSLETDSGNNVSGSAVAPSQELVFGAVSGGTGLSPVARTIFTGSRAVPSDFLGIHLGLNIPSWRPNGGNPIPAPTYAYDYARTLKAEVGGEEEVCFWSRIEQSPGIYSWSLVDLWMAATNPKKVIWVVYGTPTFYQKYPGEPSLWPSWPGIASPPTPAGHTALTAFINAVKARYGARIAAFEIWNEPTLPWTSGPTVHSDRWTPAWGAANAGGNPPFFSGTGIDLADLAFTIKNAANPVPAIGFAQVDSWDTSNTNFVKAANAPVSLPGATGTAKDHVDGWSFHYYDYSFNPNNLIEVLAGYESKLLSISSTLPMWITEIGGEDAGVFTLGDPRAVQLIRKTAMIAAARGSRSAVYYGHINPQEATNNLGDPANSANVSEALGQMQMLAGKTIVSATERTDGEIVIEFSDGSILRSSTGEITGTPSMPFQDIQVRQTVPVIFANTTNPAAITFPLPVLVGSTILVMGASVNQVGDRITLVSVADTSANGYSSPVNVAHNAFSPNVFASYAQNVSAGSPSITVNLSGPNARLTMIVMEIENAADVSFELTRSVTSGTVGGTTAIPASGTLSQEDTLAVAIVGGYIGLPSNPATWTSHLTQQNGANIGAQISSRRLTTNASVDVTVNHDPSSSNRAGLMAIFRAAALVTGTARYRFLLDPLSFTSADAGIDGYVWRNGTPDQVLAERYTGLVGDAVDGTLLITGVPSNAAPGDTLMGQFENAVDASPRVVGVVEII